MGYNISIGTSLDIAKASMKSQVQAGDINNKDSSVTLKAYNGREQQHVIIEMYYTGQPKEEVESLNVVSRHIVYEEDTNEILQIDTGVAKTLFSGDKETFSKQNTNTYLGYQILETSDIPDNADVDNSNTNITIEYDSYAGSSNVIYINFKYTKKFTGTVNIRHIYYYASGIKKYMTSTAREITGSSGTESISVGTYDSSKYKYKGYIVLYDKSLPSCYASVEGGTYRLDKSKYRSGICINFLFQEYSTETVLDQPSTSDNGYLKMSNSAAQISKSDAPNNASRINNNITDISQTSILSLPLSDVVNFNMTKLQKYYIAGLKIKEEEIKSDEDGISGNDVIKIKIIHLTVIPLIDVNKGSQGMIEGIPGVFLDTYTFLIPYKYIKYSTEKTATYMLNKSSVFYPDGKGRKLTIGNKIFNTTDTFALLSYSITDDVTYGVNTSGKDALGLVGFNAQPTFKSNVKVVTNIPNDVIKVVGLADDNKGKILGNYGNVKSSKVYELAFATATLDNIENKIISSLGFGGGELTNIFQQVSGKITGELFDGLMLEIVPIYTNVSTETRSLWQAIVTFVKCGANIAISTIAAAFGVTLNIDNTVISCLDLPKGVMQFLEFWQSLIKSSVFVYEANLRTPQTDADGNIYYSGYSIQNADGSLLPKFITRGKLDEIRNIEKSFTLATNAKKATLYYKIGSSGSKEEIADASTSLISSLVDDIFGNIDNIIHVISDALGINLTEIPNALISKKRISDLNFTSNSTKINLWQRIKNGISESVFKDISQDLTYAFEDGGYVCVYDASTGMTINSKGLKAYKEGFGGEVESIFKQEKIDSKELNGIRALSDETEYINNNSEHFEDNVFWSTLNILGNKNIFKYKAGKLTFVHNAYNKKADAVNAYTPVEIYLSDPDSENKDIISQIVDYALPDILDNRKFSFYISPGKYSNGTYGDISSGTSNESEFKMFNGTTPDTLITIVDFIECYEIKLSFAATKVKAGTSTHSSVPAYETIIVQNKHENFIEKDGEYLIKVEVNAEGDLEGMESYMVRAVAKNVADGLSSYKDSSVYKESNKYTYDEFLKLRGNICNVLTLDISDIDGPVYYDEELKEITSEKVDRLYDFRVTDVKDIDWKGIFRASGSSSHNGNAYYTGLRAYNLVEGLVKRTIKEVGNELNRTLPIGPYKSTDATYIKAPKIGYRISFDVKLSGEYDDTARYDVNYSEVPELAGTLLRNVTINPTFYYISKDGKKYYYDTDIDLYYKNDSGKYVDISEYKLLFTPNDGNRLLESYQTDDSLVKTIEELGTPAGPLTLNLKTMTTNSTNDDYQTYYGEYKLPNSTIVVQSGDSPNETNRLKDGYLGVVFKITSGYKKDGTDYTLNYSQNMDRDTDQTYTLSAPEHCNSSQWEYEGYLKQQYNKAFASAKLQLEKGIWQINRATYDQIKGTVVLFDLDARASSDFD